MEIARIAHNGCCWRADDGPVLAVFFSFTGKIERPFLLALQRYPEIYIISFGFAKIALLFTTLFFSFCLTRRARAEKEGLNRNSTPQNPKSYLLKLGQR
jgi:hypothetical protein